MLMQAHREPRDFCVVSLSTKDGSLGKFVKRTPEASGSVQQNLLSPVLTEKGIHANVNVFVFCVVKGGARVKILLFGYC